MTLYCSLQLHLIQALYFQIKLPSTDDKTLENVPVTSPIENISLRLEMNKQLLAKDDKIHNLEIRNQNLENEIRSLLKYHDIM